MYLEVLSSFLFGAIVAGIGVYVVMAKQVREAFHDPLTGLPSRRLFKSQLEKLLDRVRREGKTLCVLMGDLDGFKRVNDEHGHGQGDELLRQAAQRFRECFRASDIVCRLGGDEFVAAFVVGRPIDGEVVGRKVCAALSTPYLLPQVGNISTIGMSVGIALFPCDGDDADVILKKSDKALYVAKDTAKGHVRFYEEGGDTQPITINVA